MSICLAPPEDARLENAIQMAGVMAYIHSKNIFRISQGSKGLLLVCVLPRDEAPASDLGVSFSCELYVLRQSARRWRLRFSPDGLGVYEVENALDVLMPRLMCSACTMCRPSEAICPHNITRSSYIYPKTPHYPANH